MAGMNFQIWFREMDVDGEGCDMGQGVYIYEVNGLLEGRRFLCMKGTSQKMGEKK